MWSFLAEFFRDTDAPYTIVVMDEGGVDQPRRYTVAPRRVLMMWGGSMAGVALLVALLVIFTPVRQLIPGYGTEEIEQAAQANAVRVAAMSDSLRMQHQYIEQLRALITDEHAAEYDSTLTTEALQAQASAEPADASTDPVPPPARRGLGDATEEPEDGLASPSSPAPAGIFPLGVAAANPVLDPLHPPLLPPVDGFVTRNFLPDEGHYALDIAVDEGTPVRSVGDGYVTLADRTEDGGHTIAIHHAGGYMSVYKHNNELLKDVGDRVEQRETVALSGNSGEMTTGPHLHFELWHNGIAQDPQQYFTEP